MALSLDGLAVLGKLSANPKVFADIKMDAAKQARALVVKQLKAKAGDLEAVRSVKKALGTNAFNSILDGLSDGDVKSLLTKLDRHHPDAKTGTPAWRRDHLRDLAGGKAKPAVKAEGETAKPKRAAKPKPRQTLNLELMRARPKRR